MFDGRWRDSVERGTGPAGRRLVRMGITADMLTASGLVFAGATAVAVATGHLHLAIPLLAITGFHDLLDGPVAKASGTSSVRGAFFDSVTDRVADALVLGGVAWYLEDTHPGHLVLLPFALMAATSLVSYQRAKAESLGLVAKGGLMERAERMILLGVGFLSSMLLVPVLWVLLALTGVTALGRFVRVWRVAEAPLPTTESRRLAGPVPHTGSAGAGARPRRRGGGHVDRGNWPVERGAPGGRGRPVRTGKGYAPVPVDAISEPDLTPPDQVARMRNGTARLPHLHGARSSPVGPARAGGAGRGACRRRRPLPCPARAAGHGHGQPSPGGGGEEGNAADAAILDRWARRAFHAYARYWVEGARLGSTPRQEVVQRTFVQGLHHLVDGMAAGKGVILALPHVGSWEYGGAFLAASDLPMTAVAERIEPPELFRYFVEQRAAIGLTVIPLDAELGEGRPGRTPTGRPRRAAERPGHRGNRCGRRVLR